MPVRFTVQKYHATIGLLTRHTIRLTDRNIDLVIFSQMIAASSRAMCSAHVQHEPHTGQLVSAAVHMLPVAAQIDKKMEDALRHTVKRSLQEMSRVLNGDNKTEVVPVFTVTIVLGKTNRVELKPTVQVTLLATGRIRQGLCMSKPSSTAKFHSMTCNHYTVTFCNDTLCIAGLVQHDTQCEQGDDHSHSVCAPHRRARHTSCSCPPKGMPVAVSVLRHAVKAPVHNLANGSCIA